MNRSLNLDEARGIESPNTSLIHSLLSGSFNGLDVAGEQGIRFGVTECPERRREVTPAGRIRRAG